ncbi:IclR family transcriptional regulator [Nocardioides sp. zg-1228]|uniref:IclR family transcriptional regulator n=1 Tax=Nocardioides sp. zg-1228 TaxID=2763008 RepID=UPI001642E17A|nr:IclR family transcriptional regulator [Nocardioides sp. zg-1228]MBC2931980.1 IclR family transcriptional regulator [Nocardioides sp. zg-1228]QSF57536.1 IclR family transcriptional regulator [Nocardioides sp. zg-1228]
MNERPTERPTERSSVQSIDRAVAILRCFDAHHAALGITDIARLTGLSTSTAHRLLGSMTVNRLLKQGPDKRYRPGPLLVQLGRSGAVPSGLREAARPYMVALRDEVDETVGLHELLATYERTVVDQVESRQELRRHYTDLGVPIALTHGAPGKAMLCMLPWARQQAALARGIEPVTDKTVTDPVELAAELAVARGRGWAGSDAERTPGIRAVAAPVFDHTGSVVGALGLSVPTVRMDGARTGQLGARAAQVAWEVSEALGATRELVDQRRLLAEGPGPGA